MDVAGEIGGFEMIAAIRYFSKDYLLSYRYFAPLLVYLFALAFVYSVMPNPVMPSYSFTTSMLFIIAAWLAFGYIDLEHETQQMITSLHLPGLRSYYICKTVPLLILNVFLSIIYVVYPIVFDKFDRSPETGEVMISFLCHVAVSLMGMCGGFLFTKKYFPKWYTALGGLLGFIVISFASKGIIHAVAPALRFIEWLLPPLYRTMDMLNNFDSSKTVDIILAVVMPIVYAILLYGLFFMGMIRRRF